LVRIENGVGAEGNGLALPRRPAQFTAQHVCDVGLDHDLGVEVPARVEVEVLVRGPREAIAAGMRAAAVAVDGVPKRQHGTIGDLVDRRLAQHLVERDALELRRRDAADEADALQPGQRTIVDCDALTVPPHTVIRTPVRFDVKSPHLGRAA
jgi:hypothetical protein